MPDPKLDKAGTQDAMATALYMPYEGTTDEAERERVRASPLYQQGDTVLVWINESTLDPHRAADAMPVQEGWRDDTDRIVNTAYGWTIDRDGVLVGLTAGDHGYERTKIKLIPEDLRLIVEAAKEGFFDAALAAAPQPAAAQPMPASLARECVEALGRYAVSPTMDWTPHAECNFCGEKAPEGARIDHTPTCLITRLTRLAEGGGDEKINE